MEQADPLSETAVTGAPAAAQSAKRPLTVLAGVYGHPLHPVLVPIPIGCWVAAFVFDIASHVADDGTFLVRGAYWLVGLGVLGALAAATVGFLDLFVIPSGTRAAGVVLVHMTLNLAVTVLFAAEFWLRRSRQQLEATPAWLIVLSAVGLVGLSAAGFLGGELAYRFGVRVADESTQATGFAARRRSTNH
jgi:uncharacterized membrane protein